MIHVNHLISRRTATTASTSMAIVTGKAMRVIINWIDSAYTRQSASSTWAYGEVLASHLHFLGREDENHVLDTETDKEEEIELEDCQEDLILCIHSDYSPVCSDEVNDFPSEIFEEEPGKVAQGDECACLNARHGYYVRLYRLVEVCWPWVVGKYRSDGVVNLSVE